MIVVDVETTGIDYRVHSIVSIGAVDFFNPENTFYQECRIFPEAEVSEKALEINGFSLSAITDESKPSLEQAVKDFLQWASKISQRTIGGENPTFDRDFLRASAERYGIAWPLGRRTIDLHSESYGAHLSLGKEPPLKEGISELNADNTYIFVGLPAEPKPHNALTGAKFEAEAFSRLWYRKSLLTEFAGFPIPEYLKKW